jgi:N utilization substance protein B
MPSHDDADPPGVSSRGHEQEQDARRIALGALFEAEFGMNTAGRILERRIGEEGVAESSAKLARSIVTAAVDNRVEIDQQIEAAAPRYPVVQLARIDRALLRSAMAELLHSPATPARVAIAEWVELARNYSGEPARRLLNGVLGRVVREAADRGPDVPASGIKKTGKDRRTGGSTG